jgi:hypothetical protein
LIVPLLGSVEQAAVVRSHDAGESAFAAPFTIFAASVEIFSAIGRSRWARVWGLIEVSGFRCSGSGGQAAMVRSHDAEEFAFAAPFTNLQQASKYSVPLDGSLSTGCPCGAWHGGVLDPRLDHMECRLCSSAEVMTHLGSIVEAYPSAHFTICSISPCSSVPSARSASFAVVTASKTAAHQAAQRAHTAIHAGCMVTESSVLCLRLRLEGRSSRSAWRGAHTEGEPHQVRAAASWASRVSEPVAPAGHWAQMSSLCSTTLSSAGSCMLFADTDATIPASAFGMGTATRAEASGAAGGAALLMMPWMARTASRRFSDRDAQSSIRCAVMSAAVQSVWHRGQGR